jgi:subtilase family serine protease
VVRKLGLFWLPIVAMLLVLIKPLSAQSLLTRHMREVTRTGEAQPIGRLPADQVVTLDIVLPLRERAELRKLLKDLVDPASRSYRHFLTVPEFTARFGPTQEDYDAVVRFAKTHGLAVVGGSRDGMDVRVGGTVSAIEAAFHVRMRTYQHPTENRTFYAPDNEPIADLPFPLWHISGLDNYSIPHPKVVRKSDYAQALGITADAVAPHAPTGSGPSTSYLGSDMRAAYYGGTALTGSGQNLGLLEYYGTNLADLTTYLTNTGQTNSVPVTLLSTDGTSTSCVDTKAGGNCDDTEQTLDITQAIGMAPGLSSLVLYIGSSDVAIISAMTTHSPLPTTIGCSWGWTPADPTVLDPYFERMAAQGQTFFAASGDHSTWTSTNEAWPADDPYVVSVGGSDLITRGPGGAWAWETAWLDSGGGISPDQIAIPSWQQLPGVINISNRGSTTYRNGPDVSANANFSFYVCANQTTCTANEYGGTSFAAPMWAAYFSLVNEQSAGNGGTSVGFINSTIYSENLTSEYATNFHDVTSGISGSFSAVGSYDLVSGWGSPNGNGLINAFAPSSGTPEFSLAASPMAVSVLPGNKGVSTITSTGLYGFDAGVVLSASGQPAGVTVGFSPTSITGSGSSTVTFTVAANTTTGTYPITVTGTGGGLSRTAVISLTVTGPTFSLSVSPASGYLYQGTSGYVVVTTAGANGFSSAVALSATGEPTGVTIGFNPSLIATPGSGTSNMTLTVSPTAPTGTYLITITGTGGGVTATTSLIFGVVAK